jgi:hypothetical protein
MAEPARSAAAGWLVAALCFGALAGGGVTAHGTLQMPLPWQLGNVQKDLGSNSCVSGGCNWFENHTFLPDNHPPTSPQRSPLRTFADVPAGVDWTARMPWRSPGVAAVHSPCGSEGGNPEGCVVDSAGTLGPCTTDDGGFAYGGDGRGLGGMGVRTAWRRGDVVEVGFSIRSNQLRPFILHASVPRRPLAVL